MKIDMPEPSQQFLLVKLMVSKKDNVKTLLVDLGKGYNSKIDCINKKDKVKNRFNSTEIS